MSFFQEKIKIGNLEFPRFIGGPLDGITDSPFRAIVRDFSKEELLYTEMRHVRCIANDKGGMRALRFEQLERPLNYQVAANSLDCIEQACDLILQKGVDIVDLNIGCPARNVISSGSGSALMADLPRLKAIVTCFRKKLPIPFTVKIRAGFKQKNAIEVAQLLQDCGVDALAIHPRLQPQMFEGRPDYALAAAVKRAVNIPVIISGNVVNFKIAKMVHDETGVDGFLIGRGIWAKPWKLHEMNQHAHNLPFVADKKLILHYALRHLDGIMDYYGKHGIFVFRKHLPFYIQGQPSATQVRKEVVMSDDVNKVRDSLHKFFE